MADRITIEVRPREAEREEPRSRIGRALVCPFCRDAVGRRDSLACARTACGALYHRACWNECVGHYGGCAIWGCGSERAHEVSVLGYVIFLAKLILASLFLPPSLARRVSDASAESLPGVAVRAFRACRKVLPDRWTVGAATLTIAGVFTIGAAIGATTEGTRQGTLGASFAWAIVGVLVFSSVGTFAWALFLIWFVPFLAVVAALATRSVARLVAFAFRGALPALARADGGLTVLERLRRRPAGK